jgi:polysaccharide deacetylase family protein (PEP-CTERM system associated)
MPAPVITNALTIDVEDYFQVSAFAPHIARGDWDRRECRVERNVETILAMLALREVKATFFTLGWIAERYPQLVRSIVAEGHELASHGYGHERVTDLTPEAFDADIRRAKRSWKGFRATPSSGTELRAFRSARRTCGRSTSWRAQGTGTARASTRSGMTTTGCPTRPASRIAPTAA